MCYCCKLRAHGLETIDISMAMQLCADACTELHMCRLCTCDCSSLMQCSMMKRRSPLQDARPNLNDCHGAGLPVALGHSCFKLLYEAVIRMVAKIMPCSAMLSKSALSPVQLLGPNASRCHSQLPERKSSNQGEHNSSPERGTFGFRVSGFLPLMLECVGWMFDGFRLCS